MERRVRRQNGTIIQNTVGYRCMVLVPRNPTTYVPYTKNFNYCFYQQNQFLVIKIGSGKMMRILTELDIPVYNNTRTSVFRI
jgi:hypothetical protein